MTQEHLLTVLVTLVLLVLVFVLGFVLQRRGRPHNVLLLTAHKLIALAALILMALTVIRINQATPLDTAALIAAAATGGFFVVAIISGGLVSTDKPAPALARALHWVTPFVTIAGAAVTYFLLP
jgi:hypothetical protein